MRRRISPPGCNPWPSRTQSSSPPARVRLVGDIFDYRDLGAVDVKGIAEPVPAWQVLGQSVVTSRFEALHASSLIPLVGRGEEIELLLRRWARAKNGAGQVVLLSGEPGIGKSRIAAELQDRLRAEPHISLSYFGSPHHRDSPLHPFITHLEGAAGISREDLPATRLKKLEALLQSEESLADTFAVVADLLNLPTEDGQSAPAHRTATQTRADLRGASAAAQPPLASEGRY